MHSNEVVLLWSGLYPPLLRKGLSLPEPEPDCTTLKMGFFGHFLPSQLRIEEIKVNPNPEKCIKILLCLFEQADTANEASLGAGLSVRLTNWKTQTFLFTVTILVAGTRPDPF